MSPTLGQVFGDHCFCELEPILKLFPASDAHDSPWVIGDTHHKDSPLSISECRNILRKLDLSSGSYCSLSVPYRERFLEIPHSWLSELRAGCLDDEFSPE